jgi:hypothetical protein
MKMSATPMRERSVNQRQKGPLISGASLVELPGIELGAEIGMTCDDSDFDHAKRPQTT